MKMHIYEYAYIYIHTYTTNSFDNDIYNLKYIRCKIRITVLRGEMHAKRIYSSENTTSNTHGNFHLNTLKHLLGISIRIVHIPNLIGARILCSSLSLHF